MKESIRKTIKLGNALAVTLPSEWVKKEKVAKGSRLTAKKRGKKLIIEVERLK